jgi:hypothetical protein
VKEKHEALDFPSRNHGIRNGESQAELLNVAFKASWTEFPASFLAPSNTCAVRMLLICKAQKELQDNGVD